MNADIQSTIYKGLKIRYYYSVSEKPGKPLLLFNGVGQSIEVLEPLTQALSDRSILVYDVPGTGLSDTPLFPWSMKHHAHLATFLLDFLNIDCVDALGFSWGGVLAMHLCKYAPERVERLILVASPPGQLMIPGSPLVYMKMSHPDRFRRKDYMRSIAPDIYGGKIRKSLKVVDENAERIIPPPPKGYMYQGFSMWGTKPLLWVSKLRQKTLIMQGKDDPMIPNINALLLYELFPDSELQFFDCGHLFALTMVNQVVKRIDEFLESHDSHFSQAFSDKNDSVQHA